LLQPPLAPFPRGLAQRPGDYNDALQNSSRTLKEAPKKHPKTTKKTGDGWVVVWFLYSFYVFFCDFYGFYLVSMVCDGFVLCFLNGLIWLHGVLGWFPHQGLADDEMRLSWQECGFDCQTAGKDGLHRWWFACFYPEV
jgi:hypothetical protein